MNIIPDQIYNFYRRWCGKIEIRDISQTAKENPYSYYVPPQIHVDTIETGDHVKLLIGSLPPGREWDSERMWVRVTSIEGEQFFAELANIPLDIPCLKLGDPVTFRQNNIIDIKPKEGRVLPEAEPQLSEFFWDRCLVDSCVLDGSTRVGYLYREEPDMGKEQDSDPDSGWRIRGYRGETESEEDYDNRKATYVALCRVLDQDDSWIHLIDEPVGAAFDLDINTGKFIPSKKE